MREGSVFRRCTRCKTRATTKDRRCPKCGHDKLTWGYSVDLAPPGAARDQRMRNGFATKAAALDDMHRAQNQKAEGTYVEPSRLTTSAYLGKWVEGGCGGVRRSTLKGYEVAVRVHIVPRIGSIPLQQLTRAHVKALYEELRASGYTSKIPPAQRKHLEDFAPRYQRPGPPARDPP